MFQVNCGQVLRIHLVTFFYHCHANKESLVPSIDWWSLTGVLPRCRRASFNFFSISFNWNIAQTQFLTFKQWLRMENKK